MAGVIIPQKACAKCKQMYPATTEYFRKHKGNKFGLYSVCKSCERAINRDYEATPERKQRKREYGKSEKRKLQQHDYHLSEPRQSKLHTSEAIEKRQIADRLRNKTPKRIEREKARGKDPKRREYRKKYRETHRPLIAQLSQRRRARIRNLPNTYSKQDEKIMFEYWGNKCCICGRPAGLWHVITGDHWIPIADSRPDNPGNVPWNIVPMCHTMPGSPIGEASCNQSKKQKDPVEWLNQRLGKRKAKTKLLEIEKYFQTVKKG